ncbi:hypothetical protein QW060_27725 [Myroides ceti]|uniref:Uncharacterized protein n=1 Tax=Paenimyroides ceti TaxID=395087 RepID=A0ABT8D571_9FLAO|nr:hypothetical protein [Paenimyroides ceti]MDN3710575.1 hypothetical protein [Paenimyroides ceti]
MVHSMNWFPFGDGYSRKTLHRKSINIKSETPVAKLNTGVPSGRISACILSTILPHLHHCFLY